MSSVKIFLKLNLILNNFKGVPANFNELQTQIAKNITKATGATSKATGQCKLNFQKK